MIGVEAVCIAKSKARRIRRWIAARRRRWHHPVLARTVACSTDREIDAALDLAGISRGDLFTPRHAIAQHRVHMAHMIAAFEIDVPCAAAERWDDLKAADGNCSRCTQTGRCRRWLDWGQRNDGPHVFCPNAALFASVAARQAQRAVGMFTGS